MEIAVSVKDLTKIYKLYEDKWAPLKEVISKKNLHKEFYALKEITLNFPKGESIGVLGKNGSGKSTLLKIITGIADPTAGSVEVNGSLVFLDVSSGIDPELSGYENIFMKGALLGYSKQEMMGKVEDIIEFSELEEYIYQPVKNYSSGMRAKLGFAISVNIDPDILIVDEALAVGDSIFRDKCMKKMNGFKEQGKTIIFVSHDKNAVELFCTKAAWIHQGELITYGDSKFVSWLYNEFMSGKKTMEQIRKEIQYTHSIEEIGYKVDKNGISLDIKGNLNSQESHHHDSKFEFIIKNIRTGQSIIKPLRKFNSTGQEALDGIDEHFEITIVEKDFLGFFKPDKYTFEIRITDNNEKSVDLPIWAGKALISLKDDNLKHNTNPFIYNVRKISSYIELVIENQDKLQQQVNKMHFKDQFLHIEGIAFVRGYETKTLKDVTMSLQLTNIDTFEDMVIPVTLSETEEITEDPKFNPQGKVYKFSKYTTFINLEDLNEGYYECQIIYQMNNEPFYQLVNLIWATKNKEYPSKGYKFDNSQVEIHTGTKYLKIEKRMATIDIDVKGDS